jgi:hypothetical protein
VLDVSERYFENVTWVGYVPVAPSDTLALLRDVSARLGSLVEVFEAAEFRRRAA